MERMPQQFSSPQEEVAFLRAQLAEREQALEQAAGGEDLAAPRPAQGPPGRQKHHVNDN